MRQRSGIAATAPIGRLAGSGGRRQFLGKIGCQRLFHAVAHCQAVEDRYILAVVGTGQEIPKRIDLRLQPCTDTGGLALRRRLAFHILLRGGKHLIRGLPFALRRLGPFAGIRKRRLGCQGLGLQIRKRNALE